ncbi:hypothetical protein CCR80_11460 [Rhodothalassium salexigens]|uniref:hypothetical protein n=1 Tax=Rhodothalassium salexigens TaxID=1086 RepID=UPI001913A231|nr:hypothetical protein [Rhodothalassium salexigens]MBK5921647.1 hypothetical protein [Rhodothalassium salexigens]
MAGTASSKHSDLSLRARLGDGLGLVAAHAQAALLMAASFALLNLFFVKLAVMIAPDYAAYLKTPPGPPGARAGGHVLLDLMVQTFSVMNLLGHAVIWARICLLGEGRALAGGLDAFLRRFSVCLSRLLVGGFMSVLFALPAIMVGAILVAVLRGLLGVYGNTVGSAAMLVMVLIPVGAVAAALILSVIAEAADRRLSMLNAIRQTQPAWTRLAVIMLVLSAVYAVAATAVAVAAGDGRVAAGEGVTGAGAFLVRDALGFLTLATAVGGLAPLLRDKKKRPDGGADQNNEPWADDDPSP